MSKKSLSEKFLGISDNLRQLLRTKSDELCEIIDGLEDYADRYATALKEIDRLHKRIKYLEGDRNMWRRIAQAHMAAAKPPRSTGCNPPTES